MSSKNTKVFIQRKGRRFIMIRVNFARLNEIEESIVFYIKTQGTRLDNGNYRVPSKDYLEMLIDVEMVEGHKGSLVAQYSFLNKRINKKFYDLVGRFNNLNANYDDMFSIASEIVTAEIMKNDYIEINVNGTHRKIKDDITRIVYRLDKDMLTEVMDDAGKYYDRDTSSYENFHNGMVYLDEELDFDDGDGFKHDIIASRDIIQNEIDSHEEFDKADRLIDEVNELVGLTAKQIEFIKVWEATNYNTAQTARDLNMSERGARAMVARIRERFGQWADIQAEAEDDVITPVDELHECMAQEYVKNSDLLDVLRRHLNDEIVADLIYSADIDKEYRQAFIQFFNGTEYCKASMVVFVHQFKKVYRKAYKK